MKYLSILISDFFLETIIVFGSPIHGSVPLTGRDEDFAEFIYYSMVSLTTVGYGDYYAINPPARMLFFFLLWALFFRQLL